MQALVTRRATIKGTITRIETWFNTNKDSQTDNFEFSARRAMLIKAFTDYESVQQELEKEDETQSSDRDLIETKYCSTLAKIDREINKHSTSSAASSQSTSNTQQISSKVKRPQLNIPPFTGDITQWNAFYQLFQNLIENDQALTEIEKFIYLKSYLTGEPLNLINNIQLTSDNFKVALDSLKDRYDNQLNIIYAYSKNLLDAPSIGKTTSLRDFITYLKQTIEGLKNLQVDVRDNDIILLYHLLQKLDFKTKRSFQLELTPKERPTFTKLFEFLEKRCVVAEQTVVPDLNSAQKRPQKSQMVHFSHKGQAKNDKRSFCPYCNMNNHTIYLCTRFNNLNSKDKLSFVKTNRLCTNCLAFGHTVDKCRSRTCSICQRYHHTLLHESEQQGQQTNWRGNDNRQNRPSSETNPSQLNQNFSRNHNFTQNQS